MRKLKRSAAVIIQTADQAVVQLKLDSYGFQYLLHLLEMPAARLVKKLADARQGFNNGLIGGNFAIKRAQRIVDGTTLAVGTHLPHNWLKRLTQSFVVSGAIIWAAHRV